MSNYFSLFNIKDEDGKFSVERLNFLFVNLFVFFLPFDKFYTTLILYILIASSIISFSKQKLYQVPSLFWIPQIIFFLSLIGYFYSYNKYEAGFLLERQLSFLIFPLLLPLTITITKEKINTILISLSISCFICIIGLFGYIVYSIYVLQLPYDSVLNGTFFNHNFSSPIGIHAVYLSLFIALCFLFLLSKLHMKSKPKTKYFLYFILLIYISGLVFLSARNVLITLGFISLTIYPCYFIKRKIQYYIFSTMFVISLLYTIDQNDFLKNRFFKNLIEDVNIKSNMENSSDNPESRIQRWEGAIDLIKKSPLIGHGTGDEIDLMRSVYLKKGFVNSYIEKYNVHNQYLSILIKHGIIGLILFLFILFRYFKIAVSNSNYIYLSFLVLVSSSFLSENILDTNKGIFFVGFFSVLFFYSELDKSFIKAKNEKK